METQRVTTSRQGSLALVALAREAKSNAMDRDMFAAIADSFRALGTDPDVRAILLSGRGRHFSAGLDLQYAAEQFSSSAGPGADPGRAAEARLRHIQWLQQTFTAVEQVRAPVIAAIHGGCIGAGVDLASACDLRLCTADAFFQIAEVDVAITADLGTLQRLTHLIPEGIVRELAFTGRRMDAAEAAHYGFVNQVLPDEDALSAAALALGRNIAAKSPLAVAGAKLSLNYSRGRPVEEGLRHVAMWNAGTLISADLMEAVRARLGKTDPSFGPLDP